MKLCFAPMDGITTCPTRMITKEIFEKKGKKSDCLQVWTEFMNIDGFLINPQKVCKHLLTNDGEKPILQIFGGNEDTLLQGIREIDQHFPSFFSGIELNTGCPSNSVMKVGGGSDMMRDKERTLKIIQHLSENTQNLPFSLKSRAGLNEKDKDQQLDFLCEASKYCVMISIHGRTLKQGYQGDADWDFIQKVKKNLKNPQCLVIGNGGISTYDEACEKSEQYGLDGVMVGQAAIGNPWIFCGGECALQEKKEGILRHLDLSIAFEQYFQEFIEERSDFRNFFCIPPDFREEQIHKNLKNPDFDSHAVIEFRKFLFQYVKGIPGSKEWKVKVLSLTNYGEVRDEIQRFFERIENLQGG